MEKLTYYEVQQVKKVFRFAFTSPDWPYKPTSEIICHTSEPTCPPEVDPFRLSLQAFVLAAPDQIAVQWFRQNTEGGMDYREMEKYSNFGYTTIWNRVDDMLKERTRKLPWNMAQQAISIFYEIQKTMDVRR